MAEFHLCRLVVILEYCVDTGNVELHEKISENAVQISMSARFECRAIAPNDCEGKIRIQLPCPDVLSFRRCKCIFLSNEIFQEITNTGNLLILDCGQLFLLSELLRFFKSLIDIGIEEIGQILLLLLVE